MALAGFLIAGVPAPFLLAAVWLVHQGQVGWAIFIVLWGLLAISSIDNWVKPYLINRSSHLPLLLIVLGVFGGVIVFGVTGPPMLAVGRSLLQSWIARRPQEPGNA